MTNVQVFLQNAKIILRGLLRETFERLRPTPREQWLHEAKVVEHVAVKAERLVVLSHSLYE